MPAASWLMNLGFSGSAVVAAGPTITTTTLDNAVGGERYTAKLEATGGTEPLTWAVSAGSLPDGLQLTVNGSINGTPTRIGTFSFTVQAEDANSNTDTQALSITVVDPEVFGVWERVPLAISARARSIVQTHERAVASVAVPARAVSHAPMLERVAAHTAKAVEGGMVRDVQALASVEKAAGDTMPDSTLDDLAVLVAAGVLTAEEGMALLVEELARRER